MIDDCRLSCTGWTINMTLELGIGFDVHNEWDEWHRHNKSQAAEFRGHDAEELRAHA